MIKVVISGVPRGYQSSCEDGNWLQEKHIKQIERISPEIELIEMPQKVVHKTIGKIEGVEILLVEGGNRIHYGEELDWEDYLKFFTPSLKWVQLCSTGFSDNITPSILRGDVILTNAPGIHTYPIAESVIAAMLDHVKKFKQRRIDQKEHLWQQIKCDELLGKTVLLIGLGKIGRRIARLCKAFDMRIIGTKKKIEPVPNVDYVFSTEELKKFLPEADFIVVAAPLTPLTEKMIKEEEFNKMKDSAYLINIGRGKIIDEVAIIKALRKGRISGAYLDCFVHEPLPPGNPLWDLENVFIVPHDSHSSPHIGDRIINIFCENLDNYLKGEKMLHVCDPKRGY